MFHVEQLNHNQNLKTMQTNARLTATPVLHTDVRGKTLQYLVIENEAGHQYFVNVGTKTYETCEEMASYRPVLKAELEKNESQEPEIRTDEQIKKSVDNAEKLLKDMDKAIESRLQKKAT